MRFLADQDVYQSTVDFLRALGHDVVCVREIGMARASDEEILDQAHKEQRLLLTKDKGFGALVFLRLQEHSGVILLRISPTTVDGVHQELARLLQVHAAEDLHRAFVTVEPGCHRIRIRASKRG